MADPDPAGTRATLDALLYGPTRPSLEEIDRLFESLPPVSADAMIGAWRGTVLPTGDRWERLLRHRRIARWHGKRFLGPDRVHALMVRVAGLTFAAPLGAAILRPVEFHGRVSTAMVYCWLPIIDHFRAVDADTLMGFMETRGRPGARFLLHRETASGDG